MHTSLTKARQAYNQKFFAGCGCLTIAAVFGLALLVVFGIYLDRHAARYPDATIISTHNNYASLPAHFRWDNTYFVRAPFTRVYNWYSTEFDLGAESRALERCVLLEGGARWFVARRYMSVLICDTPDGQMVFVTRETSFR